MKATVPRSMPATRCMLSRAKQVIGESSIATPRTHPRVRSTTLMEQSHELEIKKFPSFEKARLVMSPWCSREISRMSPLCRSIKLTQALESAIAILPLIDRAIRQMGLLNFAREIRLPLSRSQTIRLWSREYVRRLQLNHHVSV